MKTHPSFPVRPDDPSGTRIFSGDKNGSTLDLLTQGDGVINGAWTIKWLDAKETVGVCKEYPGAKFYYVCHVDKSVKGDYNAILHQAELALYDTQDEKRPSIIP
jgi:hypothetical protein